MKKSLSLLMVLILLMICGCATDLKPNNSSLEAENAETINHQ